MLDRRTLLHVDDDPSVTRLVASAFERAGIDAALRTAGSAEEGSARLQREPVDCLVTDGVTFADGELFADAVRERYPEMPIVLFTGTARSDIGATTLADRRTRFVRKGRSESLSELVESVAEVLGVDGSSPWRVVGRHDWDGDRPLAATVATALDGTDAGRDGPPTADDVDGVDLAAAARFLATADEPARPLAVRFEYRDREIKVGPDGTVRVRESESEP